MYNRILLIGRLTRDPEVRYTPEGHPVASFTLAVDRPFKRNATREADFIDVAAWRKLAEVVSTYTAKGQLLTVEGRLEIRSYDDKKGIRRKGARVVATGIRLFPKTNGAAHAQERAPREADGDEPAPGAAEEVDTLF